MRNDAALLSRTEFEICCFNRSETLGLFEPTICMHLPGEREREKRERERAY